MHPARLDGALFEGVPPQPDHDALRALSAGLRMFGNSLASMEVTDGAVFINAAADVDRAAETLRVHGNAANERATVAMRPLHERLGFSADVTVCVADLPAALLREREALRVYRGNDVLAEDISIGYSRFGDLLTFMASQEDIAACIAAHRTI